MSGARAAAVVAATALTGCSVSVRGQVLPVHRRAAVAGDFLADPDTVVVHYYGAGGWGIEWRGTYLLTAPYFSNHDLFAMQFLDVSPDRARVAAGVAGTPIAGAAAVLVGHGHLDHAGDLPALVELMHPPPALVAARSTVNLMAPLAPQLGCVAALDDADDGRPLQRCALPNVRITPLRSAHAPQVQVGSWRVDAYTGSVDAPRRTLPTRGPEFVGGVTWAYLIDLLDEAGAVVFRLHYMDAVAAPPAAMVPSALLAERDVDVHIACVAGFNHVTGYPEAVLRGLHARYVLAGHWEDFLRSPEARLAPVPGVLSEGRLEAFVQRVEDVLGAGPATVQPRRPGCQGSGSCGPAGGRWMLPVPGETVLFAASSEPGG